MRPTSAGSRLHAPAQALAQAQAPAQAQTPAQALWRMREYLRPYYLGLFLMITAAILAVTAEIAIPFITKSVVDGVLVKGIRSELLPLSIAAMALGSIQAGLNFFRPWARSGAVAGMAKPIPDGG